MCPIQAAECYQGCLVGFFMFSALGEMLGKTLSGRR
jgi:hypothetical protein